MVIKAKYAILSLLLCAFVASCGDQAPPPPPPSPGAAKADAKAGDKDKKDEKKQDVVVVVKPELRKRNPFLNPFAKSKMEEDKEPRGPLECCELGSLKIAAIFVSKDASKTYAIVYTPDSKRHIVRKGVKIGKNRGVVIDFSPTGFTVRENVYNKNREVTGKQEVEVQTTRPVK